VYTLIETTACSSNNRLNYLGGALEDTCTREISGVASNPPTAAVMWAGMVSFLSHTIFS
jgi:hypothetical protein